MADIFKDREKSQEAKYKHDEELRFKAQSRRDKLLGLWVAEKIGLEGEKAEAYAREVVLANFQEPGDADIVRKVLADLKAHDITMTEDRIYQELERLFAVALEQVSGDYPKALGPDHTPVGG
jgi:hypothetical protein